PRRRSATPSRSARRLPPGTRRRGRRAARTAGPARRRPRGPPRRRPTRPTRRSPGAARWRRRRSHRTMTTTDRTATMTTTMTMTTEARITARARIVGWMLLLVGLALAGSVAVTWSVLSARLDDRVDGELTHEANKLRSYARNGVDATTGRPPENVSELLTGYLVHNLPDSYETFFSVVDGRPERRSAQRPPARLDNDPAFVAEVAKATRPTYGWATSAAGEVRYAVLPVRMAGAPRRAALVVVQFRDAQRAEVTETTRVLGFTAFGALAVAGLVGWLIAGRVRAPIRLVRQTADQIGESDLTPRLGGRGHDRGA